MSSLVTAILPVYNRSPWIARAVRSVLEQTYPSVELIVVDDGSDDGTPDVLASFGRDITRLRQPRGGAYAARNLALARARGAFIAFIDSDDAWLRDRLERQIPLFARPEVGLVYGDARHLGGQPGHLTATGTASFAITPPHRGRVAPHFAWGNFVPTSAVVVRRRCFDAVGPFSTEHPLSADYLKWFQMALRDEFDFVNGAVVDYTVHDAGISADLERSLRARISLFTDELARTTDPAARAILQRLRFNLSMHLAWATVRGRVARAPDAWRLAASTAAGSAGPRAPLWSAAFAAHHLTLRRSYGSSMYP